MELVHTRKTYTLDNHVDSLADATARTSAALDRYFSGLGLQHERIGVLLSGGVDSSLLLARSRLHFKRPLAITAEFVGYPNPELDRAREVAKILGVEHQVVQIEPQYLHDQLRRLTRIMETPVTYINNFVRLALFDRLSGQVPMVLSGEGADGMFGSEVGRAGEIDRLRSRRALFDKLPGPARAALFHLHGAVRPGFGVFEPEFKRAVRRIGEAFREPYINVPPLRAIREQRSGYFYDYLERDQDDLQKIRRDRGLFTQNRHQYYCYARLAVATGVAVDCPFLADALVDIGLALPLEHRSNASGAKPILRNLLLQDLPAEIVNASKLGFHTPSEQWINGPLAADLAMLQDDVTRRRGLYDLDAVARERDTHTLWALLTFEVFCREFIDSCG